MKANNMIACSSKTRCTAKTEAGKRCRLKVYQNGLCGSHDFAASKRTHEFEAKKESRGEDVAAAGVVMRPDLSALVRYEIDGVRLGAKTMAEAFDKIDKLVRD